jgi:hypothetical protein
MSQWAYQWEKFSVARRCLLLPHPNGEEEGLVNAFAECSHGLSGLKVELIEDDGLRDKIRDLERMMDVEGLVDSTGRGLWHEKAQRMTVEERGRFADAVDDLATWFDRESH